MRRLADAGVGAVVLYSLFEEQLRREAAHNERMAAQGSESYAESLSYFPATVERSAAASGICGFSSARQPRSTSR